MMQVPHLVGSVLLMSEKATVLLPRYARRIWHKQSGNPPETYTEQDLNRGELHGIIVLDGRSHFMAWN